VTRKPTPAPTIPLRDDPRDEEPASQSTIEQTGAERGSGASDTPELSSVEEANDITHAGIPPGVSSTQSAADFELGALAVYPPFLP
jgi:hypothetical protein